MAAEDKCIGRLYLDIKQVKQDIDDVNKFLGQIGANINLEDKLSKGVTAALKNLVSEAKKAGEEAQRARKSAANTDAEAKALDNATKLWKEYYDLMTKAQNARNAGRSNQASFFENEAASIVKNVKGLREEAEATEDVAKARRAYNASVEAGKDKSAARAAQEAAKAERERQREIDRSTQAVRRNQSAVEESSVGMASHMDKVTGEVRTFGVAVDQQGGAVERLVSTVTTGFDTAGQKIKEFADSNGNIKKRTEESIKASSAENDKTKEAINLWKEYYLLKTKAQQATNSGREKTAAFYNSEAEAVRRIASGLSSELTVRKELTKEIRAYNAAIKTGEDKKQEKTLSGIAALRQQITNLMHRQRDTQRQVTQGAEQERAAYDEIGTQLTGMLTRYLSIMAAIRVISNLINSTVEYVSEYYDKMKEIQMITLKSNEEVAQLGETYRQIAESMNVSSLDMADAAIYFTRQGLSAEEIEKRLKNVTMYAKAANVEFENAAEIMTAVINSMGLAEQEAEDGRNAAQRVADVFLKVGDSAATSGQEIGEAMQKAAAAAGSFGVSFEWLAAYIAAVSETTRQEARTIGTALNTIIARLHSIRTTGYNADDETKINDIAKALNTVNIELMDQSGNWRDMEDIFVDVSSVWDTLNDKQRSYIATTMAGVKQQNVFLALMNDMSKGAENGSRTYQLYNAAINSAGTAEAKHAVYIDSVTAAQERLTVAQEKYYSLMDAGIIKNWNNFLAGYINMITRGTEKMNSFNVVLGVLIGLAGAAITTIVLAKAELISLGAVLTTILHHPIMIMLAAFVAAAGLAVTGISALGGAFKDSTEKFNEASEALEKSHNKVNQFINSQKQLNKMFDEMEESHGDINGIVEKYSDVLDDLAEVSPRANAAVLQLKDGLISQSEAAKILSEELDKVIEKEKRVGTIELIKYLRNYEGQSGTNLDFIKRYQTWDLEWFNGDFTFEGFANALKKAYGQIFVNPEMTGLNDSIDELTNDELKQINEWLADTGENWRSVASLFWDKYVGGDSYNPTELFREKIMDMVNTTISTLGQDFDSIDREVFQNKLMEFLFDDEGGIKPATLDEARKSILAFVGLAASDMVEITPSDRSGVLLDRIFGSMLSKENKQDILNKLSEYGFDADFANAIEEMLAAGIDKVNIARFLNFVPIEKWGNLVAEMQAKLLSVISSKAGARLHDEDEAGNVDMLMWDNLSLETLQYIYNLLEAGVALEDIKQAMRDSGSVDEFTDKLHALGQELGIELKDKAADFANTIKSLTAEIDKLDKMIKTIVKGDPVDFEDLLNLANAHPEIMATINDTESLLQTLQKLKREDMSEAVGTMRNHLLTDAGFAEKSGFNVEKGESLSEFKKRAGKDGFDTTLVDQYIDQIIISFLAATDRLGNISKDILGDWMNKMFSESNVDLLNRKAVKIGDDIATVLTETFTASADGHEGLKWVENIVMNLTPITPDGKKLDDETFKKYVEDLLLESTSVDELFENDKIINGGQGLLISVDVGFTNEEFEEKIKNATSLAELLHLLQEAYYGVADAEKTWLELQLEEQEKNAELSWAGSNKYIEQISELREMLNDESGKGAEMALELWNSYDDAMKKSIADTYPGIIKAMAGIEAEMKSTERSADGLNNATKNLGKSLDKASSIANARSFTKTYDAINKLEKGTISATDAYQVFNDELDKVTKANEDINDVYQKMADGTEIAENDVSNLASVLGMSADQILQDFPGAVEVFNELIGESGELRSAFDALNEAAFIRITGTSVADFSELQNGLISVQNLAEQTIELLKATGQWDVETIKLPQEAFVWDPVSQQWIRQTIEAGASVLKAKGANPYKGTNSTGSKGSSNTNKRTGGGGGSSKTTNDNQNKMTEVELALNRMEQVHAIQEYQQSYYQAQSANFEQNGYLQGVIDASKKEIGVLEEQNVTLAENLKIIEAYISAKKQELAGMDESDEKYAEAADDLDKLQKAHQNYSKELIENKTAIDQLNESIEEQNKKIRDMEIDIRKIIYKAIEDREKKKKNMLQNEITMENLILDIIKKRYETERDRILANADARIEALQQERDLLSEQLQIRKEMAEKENKAAKLAQLEANYQRIIADPTRMKEAQKIQKEIADLREEMAWDSAEEEVKAQQDSLDQQITSLTDYKQYIEDFYDDLFEHPQKLIEEMESVLSGTDEQIIEWLKQNSTEFATSTANTQEQMVQGWQETLDNMRGTIKTYWDEVEAIIAGGDENILNFLMANDEDFAKAGKLEAGKYVDEWKKKLSDLHKAVEEAITIEAPTYTVVNTTTTNTTTTNNGGRSSGGSGGGPRTTQTQQYGYYFYDENVIDPKTKKALKYDSGKIYSSKNDAITYGETMRNLVVTQYRDNKQYDKLGNIGKVKAYLNGGLATFTGPAWLDGTASDPERVLSPYQTKLFETMVNALERIGTIAVPSMPRFGGMQTGNSNAVSVGDIIVNVDNLNTDDDYEDLANKVGAVLMERIGKTAVIGGLRING